MLGRKVAKFTFILSVLCITIFHASFAASTALSISEAEKIAIAIAPELERLDATSEALSQQAIADGQLPDPKLMAGAINVPVNSFSFTKDDMTMIEIGLQQTFPPGETLAIKSKQTQEKANAEKRKGLDQKAQLTRMVREIWLNLYYWTQAARVVSENQGLYRQLSKAAESQYSAGKGSQSDLLQVQVELSRLDDQAIQIQQQIDALRAQLSRYIGKDQADRPLSKSLPDWSKPPSLDAMEASLNQHPLLLVDDANIAVAQNEVNLAGEQYKPSVMVDVGYGIRQGHMSCGGGRRSDMVGARLTVDLPLFTTNRQDRTLDASTHNLTAAKLDQQVHYRDLVKDLTTQHRLWHNLAQRESLYEGKLIPEVRQNSKAAMMAYQSATADLLSVLRAFSSDKTIQLEGLQIKIEKLKARAALYYLGGVTE